MSVCMRLGWEPIDMRELFFFFFFKRENEMLSIVLAGTITSSCTSVKT